MSRQTRHRWLALPWLTERERHFEAVVKASLQEQQRIETEDTVGFTEYRPTHLPPGRRVRQSSCPARHLP